MTYSPNIPQPTDIPADSQGDILQNFQSLNTIFGVNHLPLTDVSPQAGYHTKVFLSSALGADPNLASPAGAIYTKTVAAQSELFFQNGALPADVAQLTALPLVNAGLNKGISTPWGYTFNFGRITAPTGGATVTFAIPYTTEVYTVQCTEEGPDKVPVSVASVSLTNMIVYSSPTRVVYYLVIGM